MAATAKSQQVKRRWNRYANPGNALVGGAGCEIAEGTNGDQPDADPFEQEVCLLPAVAGILKVTQSIGKACLGFGTPFLGVIGVATLGWRCVSHSMVFVSGLAILAGLLIAPPVRIVVKELCPDEQDAEQQGTHDYRDQRR